MTLTNGFRAALAAAPLALLAFGSAAHAQTSLAFFNFNDGPASGVTVTEADRLALFAADGGLYQSSTTITSNFPTTGLSSFNGTTNNGTPPAPATAPAAGVALAVVNQSNNGDYLQFNTSTLGFNTINFSLAIQRTATGFTGNVFQYSTNGTTFTNFATFTPGADFTVAGTGVQTFNLSGVTAINNLSNAYFRIVFNGATSAGGNNRLDNVQINGTAIGGGGTATAPEPASLALLGLGVVGIVARRRRK